MPGAPSSIDRRADGSYLVTDNRTDRESNGAGSGATFTIPDRDFNVRSVISNFA